MSTSSCLALSTLCQSIRPRASLCGILLLGSGLSGCRGEPSSKAAPSVPSVDARPVDAPTALTPNERNNTIRDLLGFSSNPDAWPAAPEIAERFSSPSDSLGGVFTPAVEPPVWPAELPAEAGVHGFDGMLDGQEPTAYGVEAWQQATLRFAPYVLVSSAFWSCDDPDDLSRSDRVSCAWTSIQRFASRAWRRPLDADETDRLNDLWSTQLDAGTVDEAIVITVSAILLSPRFTHRIEEGKPATGTGQTRTLTALELASRLSYFLWDTMPDSELFRAAEAGELETEDEVRAQVRRMLADERAHETAARFHHAWLGTEAVLTISPNRAAHGPSFGISAEPTNSAADCDLEWPGIVGPLRHALYADVSLTVIDRLFRGPATLTELLTTDVGYQAAISEPVFGDVTVDESVAPISWSYTYVNASTPASGVHKLQRVHHDRTKRAGLLASPAVLAVGAYPVHPGPIPRGVNVLERVLCIDLGDPPEGAEGTLPADVTEVERTNRTRTETATAPATCAGCHDLINPLGFAFESFDAIGAWRDTDNGFPVDDTVEVRLDGTVLSIDGAGALGAALASSDQARSCYALHTVRTATAIDWDWTDPRITALLDGFKANDHIPTLIEDIAVSDIFRTFDAMEVDP